MQNSASESLIGLTAYKRYCAYNQSSDDLQQIRELFRLRDVIQIRIRTCIIRVPIDYNSNFLEYARVLNRYYRSKFRLFLVWWRRNSVSQWSDEWIFSYLKPVKAKSKQRKGHFYMTQTASKLLLTRRKLLEICRRFPHLSTTILTAFLKRVDPKHVDSKTRKLIENFVASFNPWQRIANKTFIFQETMPGNILFTTM